MVARARSVYSYECDQCGKAIPAEQAIRAVVELRGPNRHINLLLDGHVCDDCWDKYVTIKCTKDAEQRIAELQELLAAARDRLRENVRFLEALKPLTELPALDDYSSRQEDE